MISSSAVISTIGLVDQPGCRAFRCHSMEQRLVDEVFRHPGAHGIADYLSGVHVLVSGKIEPALIRRNIRNVSPSARLGSAPKPGISAQVGSPPLVDHDGSPSSL